MMFPFHISGRSFRNGERAHIPVSWLLRRACVRHCDFSSLFFYRGGSPIASTSIDPSAVRPPCGTPRVPLHQNARFEPSPERPPRNSCFCLVVVVRAGRSPMSSPCGHAALQHRTCTVQCDTHPPPWFRARASAVPGTATFLLLDRRR